MCTWHHVLSTYSSSSYSLINQRKVFLHDDARYEPYCTNKHSEIAHVCQIVFISAVYVCICKQQWENVTGRRYKMQYCCQQSRSHTVLTPVVNMYITSTYRERMRVWTCTYTCCTVNSILPAWLEPPGASSCSYSCLNPWCCALLADQLLLCSGWTDTHDTAAGFWGRAPPPPPSPPPPPPPEAPHRFIHPLHPASSCLTSPFNWESGL